MELSQIVERVFFFPSSSGNTLKKSFSCFCMMNNFECLYVRIVSVGNVLWCLVVDVKQCK